MPATTRERVQFQMFQQAAFNTDPVTPNGRIIPRTASFDVQHSRNKLDNPGIFGDGYKREFRLGNFNSTFSGGIVDNLDFWPFLQRWLCGECVTTGAGPYVHTSRLKSTILLHEIEKGYLDLSLFDKFRDMVIEKCSMVIPVEGICTVDINGLGSGNSVHAGATSLDTTPTEVVASPGEYANMVILMDAADPANITNLTIDVEGRLVAVRPHGAGGKAVQLMRGGWVVSGTLSAYFVSDAQYLKARNQTPFVILATQTNGAASRAITMPEVKLVPSGPKVEGEDGIMQDFEYEAYMGVSADAPIKFVTTNAVATYEVP